MTHAVSLRTATRLQDAAFALLAALPLAMALANRSATLVVAVAAILSWAGRWIAGDVATPVAAFRATLRRPLALACLAFLGLALVSIGWSHHTRLSLLAYGELLIAAGAPFALHLALPRAIPRWVPALAMAFTALGAVTIVAELATGMAPRRVLGLRSAPYIFKRSVAAMLIVYWPLAAMAWVGGRRTLAAGAGILLLAAIVAGHAGAALIGAGTGLVVLALSGWRQRGGTAAIAFALGAALLLAPVLGDTAGRLLSDRLLDRLESVQARDRVAIWQSFGSAVAERPLTGLGFGTSAAAARDPVAAEVPEARRLLLGAGHPHNGFLQVWAEMGVLGAMAAALVLGCLVAAFARAPVLAALAGGGAIASVATIMLVGHGAWQGWWITTIGAAAAWCGRMPVRYASASSLAGSAETAALSPRYPVAST